MFKYHLHWTLASKSFRRFLTWKLNWKICGKKHSWPILSQYSTSSKEGLSKTTINLRQDRRPQSRGRNEPATIEYDVGIAKFGGKVVDVARASNMMQHPTACSNWGEDRTAGQPLD
jgi:hypothetical protein